MMPVFVFFFIFCCHTNFNQALNNLAVTDENKQKIVDAGVLPLYVMLLSPERDQAEQQAAAHGLWTLAFSPECKKSIVEEPGCIQGCYYQQCKNELNTRTKSDL